MPLAPIKLPPGQYLNGTRYAAKDRWALAQLVRFRNGHPCPIGGWKKVPLTVSNVAAPDGMQGICRAAITWRANAQPRWAAFGTTRKLYAFDGGTLTDITPSGFVAGTDNVAVGKGYGAYLYGRQTFGTPRTVSSITSEPGRWTLDTWGETLVGVANSDGRICQWSFSGLATPLTNAPTACRSLIVTNERMLMALGAGDGPLAGGPGVYTANPRHVWWCSQEDLTDWDRTDPTNTAGDFNLDTPGQIMCALKFSGDILIFTDQDVHRCQYLGPPLYYGFHKQSEGCGIVGPGAVVATSGQVVWMGPNGFFVYDGYVRPLPCEVQDYVLRDLNRTQAAKVHAAHNVAFNEVWWFYPSTASNENDSYVAWNYAENHWMQGRLARTAWTDANVWPYPMATYGYRKAADNLTYSQLYQHEQGWLDNASPRDVFIESGPIEIGTGDYRVMVDRIYQDIDPSAIVASVSGESITAPAFQIEFDVRNAPNMAPETFGPYQLDIDRGYTDCRFNARQVTMRVRQIRDTDWQLGDIRLNTKRSSGR